VATPEGALIASPEKALFDVRYLSGTRGPNHWLQAAAILRMSPKPCAACETGRCTVLSNPQTFLRLPSKARRCYTDVQVCQNYKS